MILTAYMAVSLSACKNGVTDREEIITLFEENRDIFLQAAESRDFSGIDELNGDMNVYVQREYADIIFGGEGLGPESWYYGIFFNSENDLYAVSGGAFRDELTEYGDGYLYEENSGDNMYYVEPLGDHFFYYELHY